MGSNWNFCPVKNTDDIPGVGFLDNLPLGGHELLRPGEADFLAALDVIDLLIRVKAPGNHPQEGDTVPMGLVHVGLNLEHEGGESVVHAVHHQLPGAPGQGGRGHAQKFLQEGLHAEVGQGGAEEHRGELPVADPL